MRHAEEKGAVLGLSPTQWRNALAEVLANEDFYMHEWGRQTLPNSFPEDWVEENRLLDVLCTQMARRWGPVPTPPHALWAWLKGVKDALGLKGPVAIRLSGPMEWAEVVEEEVEHAETLLQCDLLCFAPGPVGVSMEALSEDWAIDPASVDRVMTATVRP